MGLRLLRFVAFTLVALKRYAEPEEITQTILYLASAEAAYVTGAGLVIDGGYTA